MLTIDRPNAAPGPLRTEGNQANAKLKAGDVIMVNPGEIHDGIPFDEKARGWRIICFEPATMAGLVREGGVAREPRLTKSFTRFFACLTDPQPDALRNVLPRRKRFGRLNGGEALHRIRKMH